MPKFCLSCPNRVTTRGQSFCDKCLKKMYEAGLEYKKQRQGDLENAQKEEKEKPISNKARQEKSADKKD